MASRFRIVSSLPIGGAGCQNYDLVVRGLECVVSVWETMREGPADWRGVFNGVVAYRFRAEIYGRGFFPESYDTLCEFLESDWIEELKSIRPQGLRYWEFRHYALFMSNIGYLEVAAETFSEERPPS